LIVFDIEKETGFTSSFIEEL